jgi:hypothetical protein
MSYVRSELVREIFLLTHRLANKLPPTVENGKPETPRYNGSELVQEGAGTVNIFVWSVTPPARRNPLLMDQGDLQVGACSKGWL